MTKITTEHLARNACVYIRQSTADQLAHNHESRRRQYGLVDRASSKTKILIARQSLLSEEATVNPAGASAETTITIVADPKHLGARIGFMSVLHT
jgi:hypothetical protein